MYVTKKAASITKDVLAGKAPKMTKGGKTVEMDAGISRFLVLNCLPLQQDREYNNPSIDPPCHCENCASKPRVTRRVPCNCSRCSPETLPPILIQKRQPLAIPMAERLTDEMRILATQRLTVFRKSLWKAADEIKFGNVPRAAFLPDCIIKTILDNFALLRTP